MLAFNEDIIEKVNKWNDSFYILTDFDRTLTAGDSVSSWGVLSSSGNVPEEYIEERTELYNYYYPYEISLTLDDKTKNKLMVEWWTKHVGLFVKYKFSEEEINGVANKKDIMKFRPGAKELLKRMHEKNIPVIIISAGVGNFIEQFLINNDALYDNIYIVANFVKFENGVAVGISNNIIHSLNKNEAAMPDSIKKLVNKRENVVLFGDIIDDIRMVSAEKRDRALKVGFLNNEKESSLDSYLDYYDIVGINDATFNELIEQLKIFQ